MRYALYEHPRTRKFALLQVPNHFGEGDKPPSVATDRWFETREAAVAAVPDLLNQAESDHDADASPRADETVRLSEDSSTE
jgi:hypothetical protein